MSEINVSTDIFVTVDLGGTLVRAAAYTRAGEQIARVESASPAAGNSQKLVAAITDAIRKVWHENILAIGLGAPGPLNPQPGIILQAPNLPGLDNFPLAQELQAVLGCPVYLGNDANLAALAEWRFGAGRGHTDLLYLTISTGIGGGVITGGRLLTGNAGLAAELGHVSVMEGGPLCGCGQHGHLEAVAAGPAIARLAREHISAGAKSQIIELVDGDDNEITAAHVGQAAKSDDQLALEVLATAGWAIGRALAGFAHSFNPGVIILGGGVIGAGEAILKPIRTTFKLELIIPEYHCPVVTAALEKDVGLLGALVLATENTL